MMSDAPSGRLIAFDCRHFRGDRPCTFHKRTGVLCECQDYDRVDEHLLVIKLDAMGDVLRSTSLLPALREVHPRASITWVTRRESVPLLERNPFVDEVLEYGVDSLLQLGVREYDRVINLDASRTSAALAAGARGRQKDGFLLDARGYVQSTNPSAGAWLATGVFDDLKRAGRSTYQEHMLAILGLTGRSHRYVLHLTDGERQRAREHLRALGVDLSRPVVGLNTGAGGRWPLKQWREDGYVELISRVQQRTPVQWLLLGGPAERERNGRLQAASAIPIIDTGSDNSVRQFAAIVGCCDVVVTGDTLAMHVALALDRRVVVVFGPTSAPEIDLYGLGEKVVPDMECLSCYKTACDFSPNCMDLVSVDMMESALVRQLREASPGPDLMVQS